MLGKLKQMNELRNIQKKLKKESVEVEKNGVRVLINGAMEIQNIVLSEELDKKAQEDTLIKCINDAMRQMQMKMAKAMGGLGGLLGG